MSHVWLTGELKGSWEKLQVWVEETYLLDVSDGILQQLAPSSELRERLFRALDAGDPICCMAALDGETLVKLEDLFFPET